MVDKIYIPTLDRVDKQVTWNCLPSWLQDITVLVVQPKEKELHGDKPILVLPDNDIGMSNTRKWIWEQGHNQIYGVFDDDLTFVKRLPNNKKLPMTSDDWHYVIKRIDNWLQGEFTFSGFRRQNLPPRDKEWSDNTESLQAMFYNGKVAPRVDEIFWSSKVYAEDVNLHLQLILTGHSNRVFNRYGMISKQFTQGGCQSDTSISKNGRTAMDIDASHKYMVDNYYPYANYLMNNGKVKFNDDGSRKIQIQYSKALGKWLS